MLAAASTGKLLAKTQATTVQRLGFVDRMATSLVTKQAELASELDQIWWCEIWIDDHIFPGFVLWFATGPILGPGSYHRPICVRICSLLTWARPGIFAINLWNQSQRHILSSWVFHSLNWITIVIIRISYQITSGSSGCIGPGQARTCKQMYPTNGPMAYGLESESYGWLDWLQTLRLIRPFRTYKSEPCEWPNQEAVVQMLCVRKRQPGVWVHWVKSSHRLFEFCLMMDGWLFIFRISISDIRLSDQTAAIIRCQNSGIDECIEICNFLRLCDFHGCVVVRRTYDVCRDLAFC